MNYKFYDQVIDLSQVVGVMCWYKNKEQLCTLVQFVDGTTYERSDYGRGIYQNKLAENKRIASKLEIALHLYKKRTIKP